MDFRRLLPEPAASVTADALLDSMNFAEHAPAERPYTVVNFISSADGSATFQGHSGPLGDDGDRALFHGLRERVDAVLAGTGTLRTERYGRILGKSERRERRTVRGHTPEPLAVLATRSGMVPVDIPLFAEPEARVVIFSPRPVELAGTSAQIDTVQLEPTELTLTSMMRRLRHDFGIRSLLCEGGPLLFGALLEESLVDELFLTLAPKLTGGGRGPRIIDGAELAAPQTLQIRWLLERHGALYLRYGLVPGEPPSRG